MQMWPNSFALAVRAQLRSPAEESDTDTTVRHPAWSSSAQRLGHSLKKAMDDLLELDRIVLRLRLEGGSSNGRTAAMLGLEQEIVDVSLLRRMHRVLERRRPDARRRITPQGDAELGPSTGLTDSLVGRTLSRYRVLDLIGFGGMGVVYRAFDGKLEREVALKVLPSDRVADPGWRRRFLQEARTAASLECPHICLIHEVGEADGMLFMAMELIRGGRLFDVLRHARHTGGRHDPSPLPLRRALELATEIAQGLARAHERGIAHLDLKPSNVMVTESGHAKLIDFGLARLLEPPQSIDSEGERLSYGIQPGRIRGTPSYMSPEQKCGLVVDQRSDIFTFGVLLHEMVTGAKPLRPRARAGRRSDPPPSAVVPPTEPLGASHVTSGLQYVLDRCLARAPRDRYQNMRNVLADLHEVGSWVGSIAPSLQTAARVLLDDAQSPARWAVGPTVSCLASGPSRPQAAGRPLASYDARRSLEP